MEKYFVYIALSAICLSVFYGIFKILLKSDMAFKTMRLYLMSAFLISIVLPFTNFQLELPSYNIGSSNEKIVVSEEQGIKDDNSADYCIQDAGTSIAVLSEAGNKKWNYKRVLALIYFGITCVLGIRLLISLSRIFLLWYNSVSIVKKELVIETTRQIKNSFSFFNVIFLNKEEKTDEEINSIIAHESIHASQLHSLDILLIELLSAVMWFNPVVWMMRKSLQQIHEYLADEGALSTGVNKSKYQALLLNQVAEERLISLSSGFNHSLIKKRIIMMTKPKLSQKTNLKILTIIPVAALLFLGVACVNGQVEKNNKVIAAIAPTKMNVLYLGVDNPMSIAVSGYDIKDIEVKVRSNGRIEGSEGKYIVKPIRPGNLWLDVYADGEIVQSSEFRVKTVPDPVAKVAGKKGGTISKEELLKAGRVYVEMENFDFDLRFEMVSYVMSATVPGSYEVREEISKTESFSPQQIELINSLIKNQKLMIEEIRAKGPDGSIRKMGSMVFTIL